MIQTIFEKTNVLTKIIIFLVLLIICDQLVGKLLRYLYFNQKAGQQHALNQTLNEEEPDILILGNSRAQHHYIPNIFTDSLNMSCYNGGQDGGHSILLPYAQLKIILRRYTPKLVIIEFNPASMHYNADNYERLSILLPYIKQYPEIKPLVKLRSKYETIKLMSSIYPFNSSVINMVRFNIKRFAKEQKDYNGYVPINRMMMKPDMDHSDLSNAASNNNIDLIPDQNAIDALIEIIQLCKQKDIRLVLINSPVLKIQYNNESNSKEVINKVTSIIEKENIEYYDYNADLRFYNHFEFFADYNHLNDSGARLFTSSLTKKIGLRSN